MTETKAREKYPNTVFVWFGFEDDGTADVGVYASQEDADRDSDRGENKRMVARIKLS